MEIFNVDYSVSVTNLFRELFKFKKYKSMPLVWAILVGIFMLPFTIISFLSAAFIYLLHFFIKIIMIPTDFLHGVLRDEKSNVSSAAQVVVYLVSWPIVFFGRIFMAFLVFFVNLIYVGFSISSFTWSLGAFRFHLFINKMDDSYIETEGEYHKLIPMIFVIISAVITILIPIILTISSYAKNANQFEYYDTSEILEILFSEFVAGVILLNALHVVVAFLYNLFVFAPRPNCRSAVKATETVGAEAPAEAPAATVEETPAATVEETPVDDAYAYAPIPPTEESTEKEAPAQTYFYSNSEPPSYT